MRDPSGASCYLDTCGRLPGLPIQAEQNVRCLSRFSINMENLLSRFSAEELQNQLLFPGAECESPV
jgi:hypothetical protein